MKTIPSITGFFLINLAFISLLSCKKENPNLPQEVVFANVVDAIYLGADKSDSASTSGNNLVKLVSTQPGPELLTVDFLDENGDVLGDNFSRVFVSDIVPLTKEYTVLCGTFEFFLKGGDKYSNALLLNNKTGYLYDLESQYTPDYRNYYMSSRFHQQDAEGLVYFIGGGGLRRLQFSQDGEVSMEQYMDYGLEQFYVDPGGNIYFDMGKKVKMASGGIVETGDWILGFSGFEGKTYGFSMNLASGLNIYKLSVENGSFSKEVLSEMEIYFEGYYDGLMYYRDSTRRLHLFFANNLMRDYGDNVIHVEHGFVFDETTLEIYDFSFLTALPSRVKKLGIEGNHYWIQDKDDVYSLSAINLDRYKLNEQLGVAEFSELHSFRIPDHVEIYSVDFNLNHNIEFFGYDLHKEKQVKGFVTLESGVVYWEEDSRLGSTTLMRIN